MLKRFGLAGCLLTLATVPLHLVLAASQASTDVENGWGGGGPVPEIIFRVSLAAFPIAAFLILSSQPRNRIGWLLLLAGASWGLPLRAVYDPLLRADPSSIWGGVLLALDQWTWVPGICLVGVYLTLLFPDGKLPSRRWRPLLWVVAAAMTMSFFAIVFAPGEFEDSGYPGVENPLGISFLAPVLTALLAAIPLIPLCVIASAVALVGRFRRSVGHERLQMKWFAASGAAVAFFYMIAMGLTLPMAALGLEFPGWLIVPQYIAITSFALIPAATAAAVLKHNLYGINVIINKAILYALLAGFITTVYVGIVAGIGALVGAGDQPSMVLSIAATALVAVAFQPARSRAQRFANRLVYGQRVTPYEAITSFSHRMAQSLSLDAILPQIAEAAANGVGASRSRVRLFLPEGGEKAVTWPSNGEGHYDRTLEVSHQDQVVGEISVAKARGEQLTKQDEAVLADFASHAGLAMRNLRLTEELRRKLGELEESRKRIVSAQDSERRRMERDIHDGAQQQLVSMSVKLGLAKQVLSQDPDRAGEVLDDLRKDTGDALETLRELARGLFPPILQDKGLASAVQAHVDRMNIGAVVTEELGGARFGLETEANIYFVIREALQNAGKHAAGAVISVRLWTEDEHLLFKVSDRGPGFDAGTISRGSGLRNMEDRLGALNGELKIESAPGQGTTIWGKVPYHES